MDFKTKSAAVEFDERVISAQELAGAAAVTPHMMGRDMQYGGILLLHVNGLKDEATGKKAMVALTKVAGVAKVTPYSKHQAVGVQFGGKGKVTTKQLIDALNAAGLKGSQYGIRSVNGASGQAMNSDNSAIDEHAGMQMGNGSMGGKGAFGAVGRRMGCRCGCHR